MVFHFHLPFLLQVALVKWWPTVSLWKPWKFRHVERWLSHAENCDWKLIRKDLLQKGEWIRVYQSGSEWIRVYFLISHPRHMFYLKCFPLFNNFKNLKCFPIIEFFKNFVEESLSSMLFLFGGLSLVSHLLIRRRELFVEKKES